MIKKTLAFLMTVGLISSTMFFNCNAATTLIQNQYTYRYGGVDRYATSILISKAGWTQSNYAILTTGENYPDVLASGPLAKKYDCPILINTQDSLSKENSDEIKRLGVKEVFILGGNAVISQKIENTLVASKIKVTRLWGQNRYETAARIAEKVSTTGEVTIATGEDYADALSLGAVASARNIPILLNTQDALTDSVSNFIKNSGVTNIYTLGDIKTLQDKVYDDITKLKVGYEKITSKDKYERNVQIIDRFSNDIDFSTIFITTGNNFPDSLSGIALAAKTKSPIFMIDKSDTSRIKSFLKNKGVKNIVALGGTGVVSDAVIQDVLDTVSTQAKTITVSDTKGLIDNISPNTTIILKAGDYDLLSPMIKTNPYVSFNKVYDGYELLISSADNLTIKAEDGATVNLKVNPRYANVITFMNCNNVNISGVVAGHTPNKGSCTGGVFKMISCNYMKVDNSILYGCGTMGLDLDRVNNLQFTNSTIKECTYGIMKTSNSKNLVFSNSKFYNNEQFDLINVQNSNLKFDKCEISGNKILSSFSKYLFNLDTYSDVYITNSVIKNNLVPELYNRDGKLTYLNTNFENNDF